MNNEEALELLSARNDGELSADQERALDAWLLENPDGKIVAEAFRSQDAEMRHAFEPRREAASHTAERVIAQLHTPPAPAPASPVSKRSRWRHFLHSLPPITAVAVLAFVAIFWLRPPELNNPTTPPKEVVRVEPAKPPVWFDDVLVPRAKPPAPVVAAATIGQKLTTDAGEKKRSPLPDGSAIYLDQNTVVTLESERTVRLEKGRIFVEAVPADKEAGRGSFLVWTPERKIEALGTKFAVDAIDKTVSVLVTQGSVKVEGADKPVMAGQVLTAQKSVTVVNPARRASHDLDWTRELMVAADTPLVPAGKYDGGALVAVDPYGIEAKLSLTNFHVDVHIEDGFARTTIDQSYFNHEEFQMEGTFYFPLPPDASLSRLAMYVANGETCSLMEGGMAERDHARQTYEKIRHARKDPALLEWVDGSLFKMRVFPLEARQEKRIILSYSQKLPVQYGRTTYRFPAGHNLNVVKKWSFEARVKNGGLTATSPSHPVMKIERKGNDLLLRDKADNVKADRDVVLELSDSLDSILTRGGVEFRPEYGKTILPLDQAPGAGERQNARWSTTDFEGAKYLLLRYRPELLGAPKRERRDWVFLFEASGARDPLVARAQVEVIRALLNNAEHDDTFAVLTAGTRVRSFSKEPLRVTAENVAKAIGFLEQTHLIGALNLEQALIDAEPLLNAGKNPHLVHVGGGVATLGEQRADKLIPRIPQGSRYVGVAVGKRFSPAFMKVAAEKTGGFFTNINPDEPIAWRGFELAAALNTPRLMNISATVSQKAGEETIRFLPFTNAISQGEEFAAVARIYGPMPSEVTINGTLDGVSFGPKTIAIADPKPNAGYLPRTWAKLEIDRLLAEDAGKHYKAIVEMSKTMYVMTPFTSLLVLENEEMYREHNVDRGRKDHWAMYPCPEKIPVVYIPDPNKPSDRNAPQFAETKPHENQVKQTIMMRQPARYLTWPGRNDNDEAVVTSGKDVRRAGNLGVGRWEALGDQDTDLYFARPEELGLEAAAIRGSSLSNEYRRDELSRKRRAGDVRLMGTTTPRDRLPGRVNINMAVEFDSLIYDIPDRTRLMLHDPDGLPQLRKVVLPVSSPVGLAADDHESPHPFPGLPSLSTEGERLSELYGEWNTNGPGRFRSRSGATRSRLLRSGGGIAPVPTSGVEWAEGNIDAAFLSVLPDLKDKPTGSFMIGSGVALDFGFVSGIDAVLHDRPRGPRYYGRPSFSGENRVFTDLASYAPGMSSSAADVQAVLEAEALPRAGLRRGKIDDEARKRIESARTAQWRGITLKDGADSSFVLRYDGQGRYSYERRLPLGLIEQVICDGTTLQHLYPELGIGAKRTVSRFHRAELSELLPDVLPPTDDLAWGANVEFRDGNTVAIVPLPPAGAEESSQPRAWIECHLVFEGNRLAQRRWLLMPKKKELGREVYEAAGDILLVDAKGKEAAKDKREIKTETTAANLKPDVSALVILSLPLRSRQHVYAKYDLDPNHGIFEGVNQCIEFLAPEAALELFACEFASNRGSQADDIWYQCFRPRGDKRIGFFTLMLSSGYDASHRDMFRELQREALAKNQMTPLMRYLSLVSEQHAVYWQQQLGLLPGPIPANDFLGNLLDFRAISLRWQSSAATDWAMGHRAQERERALAFVNRHAGDVWGWCALGMVADRADNAAFRQQIAAAWSVLAEKSGSSYPARYEQAVQLYHSEKTAEAQTIFRKLFDETFAKGVLPPIDSRFRDAMSNEWPNVMREAATKSIAEKHRPMVVGLAWQCRQLGDHPLADQLLALALENPEKEQAVATRIAAIEYLFAIEDFDQADRLGRELLMMSDLQKQPSIWRLAGRIAQKRGERMRQFECLENAIDREFAKMPEVFSVEPIRKDYGALLDHYEWLAEASRSLKTKPPADLMARTVRAADRWRSLDPEATTACDRAAKILRMLGGTDADALAWDFLTTPLALKPNESAPWLSLAQTAAREGDLKLADQCYEAGFAAEPTNAQILWDRAQLLERNGDVARGRGLLKQIKEGDWQPRFEGLKTQARQVLEGK